MVDAMRQNLQLRVSVPEEQAGLVSAGYRNFQVPHAIDAPGGPPLLREGGAADHEASNESISRLMGTQTWRPRRVVLRGVHESSVNVMPPNSEIWVRTEGLVGEMKGKLTLANRGTGSPMVRVVWYKGGRLQMMQQGPVPKNEPFYFHVWCAEPGGWIALLVDPGGPDTDAVQLEITAAEFKSM